MKNYLTLILFVLWCSSITFASGPIRQWQTVKTRSLAGAGVAAPNMLEGLFLNPADFSFFTQSSIYFQNNTSKYDGLSNDRMSTYHSSETPQGYTAALTDGSNDTKGGFAYSTHEESGIKRKRYTFGFSQMLDQDTSFGLSYNYTNDVINDSALATTKQQTHVVNIGLLQVLSSQVSWGVVWYDPAWADRYNSKTVWGIQYKPLEDLTLLLDAGSDIKRSINKTYNYSTAIEYQIYKDLYLRYGIFTDKIYNSTGSGMGIGWNGPRLGVEIALKKSKRLDNLPTFIFEGEKLTETTFALTYIF